MMMMMMMMMMIIITMKMIDLLVLLETNVGIVV